jgi:2-oxoglutarate dehydrogenase E2 component (dihydrolipoamide succinyltransferase)
MTKSVSKDVERVKMTGMRKAIADNMVKSFYEAPHATLVTEVDLTDIVQLIQKEKEAFLAKNGFKLTITSFVARAISRALRDYPFLNSSLEEDTIVVKKFVNIGIAVSVDQGIMVPVVQSCQTKSLTELAQAIGDVSARARTGKLTPDEVKEGTITLTNFGISGVMIGIPIIRYPEVAIIGLGAICKKVVARDDDTFGVRSVMNISLTFDHRVIDGMYGCGFLNSLKEHLEKEAAL